VKTPDKSIQTAFKKRIKVTDSCWYFMKLNGDVIKEHPKFMWKGTSMHAHRLSYLMHIGDIDYSHNIYRACGDVGCLNPEHLLATDPSTAGVQRSEKGRNQMANLTHCKRGHEFTSENTRVKIVNGRPNRSCKACVKVLASSRSQS